MPMSIEQPEVPCGAFEAELSRAMCDPAETSAALRSHLEACAACRAALASGRELVGKLRGALRPEARSDSLTLCIRARLDSQTRTPPHLRLQPLRLVGAAAAACLLATSLGPWGASWHTVTRSGDSWAEAGLTREDAAAITAAVAFSRWNGAVEYGLQELAERVADLAQSVEAHSGAGSGLPWGREDDWDTPADDTDASDRGSSQRVLAAGPGLVMPVRSDPRAGC